MNLRRSATAVGGGGGAVPGKSCAQGHVGSMCMPVSVKECGWRIAGHGFGAWSVHNCRWPLAGGGGRRNLGNHWRSVHFRDQVASHMLRP